MIKTRKSAAVVSPQSSSLSSSSLSSSSSSTAAAKTMDDHHNNNKNLEKKEMMERLHHLVRRPRRLSCGRRRIFSSRFRLNVWGTTVWFVVLCSLSWWWWLVLFPYYFPVYHLYWTIARRKITEPVVVVQNRSSTSRTKDHPEPRRRPPGGDATVAPPPRHKAVRPALWKLTQSYVGLLPCLTTVHFNATPYQQPAVLPPSVDENGGFPDHYLFELPPLRMSLSSSPARTTSLSLSWSSSSRLGTRQAAPKALLLETNTTTTTTTSSTPFVAPVVAANACAICWDESRNTKKFCNHLPHYLEMLYKCISFWIWHQNVDRQQEPQPPMQWSSLTLLSSSESSTTMPSGQQGAQQQRRRRQQQEPILIAPPNAGQPVHLNVPFIKGLMDAMTQLWNLTVIEATLPMFHSLPVTNRNAKAATSEKAPSLLHHLTTTTTTNDTTETTSTTNVNHNNGGGYDNQQSKILQVWLATMPHFRVHSPLVFARLRQAIYQRQKLDDPLLSACSDPNNTSTTSSSSNKKLPKLPRINILNRRGSRSFVHPEHLAQTIYQALVQKYDRHPDNANAHGKNETFDTLSKEESNDGNDNLLSVEIPQVHVHYMEGKSFEEQIAILASTDILLSPHGAQLIGIPFLPVCGSVLEFFPQNYLWEEYFGSLAKAARVSYSYLYVDDGSDGGDLEEDNNNNNNNNNNKVNHFDGPRGNETTSIKEDLLPATIMRGQGLEYNSHHQSSNTTSKPSSNIQEDPRRIHHGPGLGNFLIRSSHRRVQFCPTNTHKIMEMIVPLIEQWQQCCQQEMSERERVQNLDI